MTSCSAKLLSGFLANALEAAIDTLGGGLVKDLATKAGTASGCGQQLKAAGYIAATVGVIALSAVSFAGAANVKGFALQFKPGNFWAYEKGTAMVSTDMFNLIKNLNPVQKAAAIKALADAGVKTSPAISSVIRVLLTTTPTPAASLASIGIIQALNYLI